MVLLSKTYWNRITPISLTEFPPLAKQFSNIHIFMWGFLSVVIIWIYSKVKARAQSIDRCQHRDHGGLLPIIWLSLRYQWFYRTWVMLLPGLAHIQSLHKHPHMVCHTLQQYLLNHGAEFHRFLEVIVICVLSGFFLSVLVFTELKKFQSLTKNI